MNTTRSLRNSPRTISLALLPFLAALLLAFAPASIAFAQQSYKTPEAAVDALVSAARSSDQKAALVVLGHRGSDIISSGDKVSDAATRQRFIAAYDAKHQITMADDNRATLIVGDNDYPFPIPIVRKGALWSFDTEGGRREIMYRRIGRNELDTIQTCLAYVDAQNEYASKDRTGAGVGVYAQRFISSPGKNDGLYWPTAKGEEESPLGALFPEATREGYRAGQGRSPYHGYYYKILTKQGSAAPGGAVDYLVNGKMVGGFAMVAYPAQYRNSGVMTFIVNHNGVVYQQDLGRHTIELAERMTLFNPDASWKQVEVTEPANVLETDRK